MQITNLDALIRRSLGGQPSQQPGLLAAPEPGYSGLARFGAQLERMGDTSGHAGAGYLPRTRPQGLLSAPPTAPAPAGGASPSGYMGGGGDGSTSGPMGGTGGSSFGGALGTGALGLLGASFAVDEQGLMSYSPASVNAGKGIATGLASVFGGPVVGSLIGNAVAQAIAAANAENAQFASQANLNAPTVNNDFASYGKADLGGFGAFGPTDAAVAEAMGIAAANPSMADPGAFAAMDAVGADAAAAAAAAAAAEASTSDSGLGSMGGPGGDAPAGPSGEGQGLGDGEGEGFARGGFVHRNRLRGPDPRGPDDGYAALDHGEYVIRADAVRQYGRGLLDAINSGDFKPRR